MDDPQIEAHLDINGRTYPESDLPPEVVIHLKFMARMAFQQDHFDRQMKYIYATGGVSAFAAFLLFLGYTPSMRAFGGFCLSLTSIAFLVPSLLKGRPERPHPSLEMPASLHRAALSAYWGTWFILATQVWLMLWRLYDLWKLARG